MASLALVRYKTANTEVKISGEEDIFGNLPREIIQEICFYFSTEELRQVLRCLPKWRKLLNDDSFWKILCVRRGYHEIVESARSVPYKEFLEKVDSYWQGVYFYNYGLYKNWIEHNYEEVRYVNNDRDISTVYYFDDELLVVSNDETDDLIDIRYVKSNKITHILKSSFEYEDDGSNFEVKRCGKYLCCFFLFRGFRIWDAYEGICVTEQLIEQESIRSCFVFPNCSKYIILCYTKFVIRLDLETEDAIRRDLFSFSAIAFDNDLIAYGLGNYVYIINWDNQPIMEITCCCKQIPRTLRLKGNYLYICCESTYQICVWDIREKIKIKVLPHHSSGSGCFRLHNQQAFEWTSDNNLTVWNFNDDTNFTIENKTGIWNLEINDRFVVIHSEREVFITPHPVVKIWCRKTGKFIRSMTYSAIKVIDIWSSNTMLMMLHVARESRTEMLRIFDYEKKIPLEFP